MSKSRSDDRPTLIVTPGEPAGIGPDICLSISNPQEHQARLVFIADPDMLTQRASQLGISASINDVTKAPYRDNALNLYPVYCAAPVVAGTANTANAHYVLATLEQAVKQCINGDAQGMVTGPVNKAIINDAGIPFSGHTEWLAERTGTDRVVMMLAGGNLRVALATTHLPLSAVPSALNREMLTETITIIMKDLQQRFGISSPRLQVCGLNPHAGEGGHLGREEIEIIEPVLAEMRSAGHQLIGPTPADTAFTPRALKDVDAVLAMYHDQGLPVLKHAAFGEAINITLGLPIIRTSVDHGTAFDLAGTGLAESDSLLAAIRSATELATHA